MDKFLVFLSSLLLASCASAYRPPVSSDRASSASPSVAVESAWVSRDTSSYHDGSWMRAVYTNPVIRGTMFFEVVSADDLTPFGFADSSRERLMSEGLACSEPMYDDLGGHTVRFRWWSKTTGRSGAVIVAKLLGQKTRYLVCTGSWSLYGSVNSAEYTEQSKRNNDRLSNLCLTYSQN